MVNYLLAIGNVYVETNYLGLDTAGKDILEEGREYKSSSYEIRLGGSVVNFITQAKKLGSFVGLIGKIGIDEPGEKLLSMLNEEGVATDLIIADPGVKTSVDTGVIFEHSGENIQLISGNANQSFSIKDINFDSSIFTATKAIYFGGFFKQTLLLPSYIEIFQNIQKMGIQLFLDSGRVPVDVTKQSIEILRTILPLTSGYFPNEDEAKDITHKSNINEAIKTISSWGVKLLVVKKGADGCTIAFDNKVDHISGYKVKAISTVGAGDAFNAGFVTSLLNGKSIKDAGIFANATAAFRVSKNRQPTSLEVEEFLKRN
jgi:sugar/nucleoside kinase (ribokinase family)